MKKVILAILFSTTLCAALPPFAESTREICVILQDTKLYDLLGSAESVDQVVRTSNGFDIMTRSRTIHAIITYLPSHTIGRVPFTVDYTE